MPSSSAEGSAILIDQAAKQTRPPVAPVDGRACLPLYLRFARPVHAVLSVVGPMVEVFLGPVQRLQSHVHQWRWCAVDSRGSSSYTFANSPNSTRVHLTTLGSSVTRLACTSTYLRVASVIAVNHAHPLCVVLRTTA